MTNANYQYLKSFNCVQIDILLLDCDCWNSLIVYKYIIFGSFKINVTYKLFCLQSIYLSIYIYIYIYCHPQTDCFVVPQLFSLARHVGHSKLGSKPAQLYVRLSIRPPVSKGNYKVLSSNSSNSARLFTFYILPDTRVLNSLEELCIMRAAPVNSFARVRIWHWITNKGWYVVKSSQSTNQPKNNHLTECKQKRFDSLITVYNKLFT